MVPTAHGPRHTLERALARTVVRLPPPLLALAAGRPVEIEGKRLDRPLQALLRLHRLARRRPASAAGVAAARADFERLAPMLGPPSPPLDSVITRSVPGGGGERAARFYRPRGLASPAPALLYFHGGGFVVGSLDSHDAVCRALAARGRCVVVSLDYRLAPEHKLPAALDDARAAFRFLHAAAPQLGLDRARLAVGGDSAGGNLAAVLSQVTRAEAARPCFQLLVYPAVDQTMSFPSIGTYARGYLLEKAQIEWYRGHYLPEGHDRRDPLASPLYGEVDGAPPAYLATAGFDPLRDEGDAYAGRLRAAGVPVEHRGYPSLFHGYLNTGAASAACLQATLDAGAALEAALHRPAAAPAG